MTANPTKEWIILQIMLAFPEMSAVKYLIQDNDQLFLPVLSFIKETMRLKSVRTQIASPWMNGIAERFIRTLRTELLQFLLPISVELIRTRLLEFKEYYNAHRTHTTLGEDSPHGREVLVRPQNGKLVAVPHMGGLHHSYGWREAA